MRFAVLCPAIQFRVQIRIFFIHSPSTVQQEFKRFGITIFKQIDVSNKIGTSDQFLLRTNKF